MHKVCCGTPNHSCTGGTVAMNSGWSGLGSDKSAKVHSTSTEAFNCYSSYLQTVGYTRIGSREFETPTGSILVLNKKSHFGAVLRSGKTSEGGKAKNRFVPPKMKGASGGTII